MRLSPPPIAGLAEVGDAISSFVSSIAHVHPIPLLAGLACFGVYLTIRSRAFFHALRAAYPTESIAFRRIWGAYVAAYGFNNVIPARGGDVIKLFLVKTSVDRSTYPAVGAAIMVEGVFDLTIAVPILVFAFTQGVFPKPPDFASLNAFDLSLVASNPKAVVFVVTVLVVASFVVFALLVERARRFWIRVRQGVTILRDRERYLREVWLVQLAGYGFRFAAFWLLLDAFRIGGSVRNVLLVLAVNAVAALMPFTPGGAGVQQAFLVTVFAGVASGGEVAAYSVGQQIAIAVFSLALGFVALVRVFGIRSFREVIAQGRDHRRAERAAGTG